MFYQSNGGLKVKTYKFNVKCIQYIASIRMIEVKFLLFDYRNYLIHLKLPVF